MSGHVREQRLNDFANSRNRVDGPEKPWVYCARGFRDWGNNCAASILRELGSLKGRFYHPGKYMGLCGGLDC